MGGDGAIYKVVYLSQGQVVELYSREVAQGGLFGFVEVADLVWGTRSELVVDPTEEALRKELSGVRRLYLPLHAIVRIEEVEREGTARSRPAREGAGSVAPFPVPVWSPGRTPQRD